MKPFVGRSAEVAVLEAAYHSPESSFYPVYGRRRVGKTELLLHFTKNKPSIFYLGKEAAGSYQVREFLELAALRLQEPLLAELGEMDWRKAFKIVLERAPQDQKLILVLDEFQWMVAANPELPSIIQELWDLEWSRNGRVMLILCGSYLGFMEREILDSKSPLFGRRSGQIKLNPFGFREAAEFHPKLSRTDQARIWFLCGGIPYYLKQFESAKSLAQNIQINFLTPHAALFREADFLLREELREVEHYYAILMALSLGSLSAAEIAKKTSIPSSNIQYYLNSLIELGYLARHYPLTGKKPTARSVRFRITDPLLIFWFRFGFPNLSRITVLGPTAAWQQIVQPQFESYCGSRFEALCREALPQLYHYEELEISSEIGEYWDKGSQIDLVSIRSDQWIDLGECKWGTIRSWPTALREVETKVTKFPNPLGHSLGKWLFSRQTPKFKEKDGVRCVGLEQLYS